MRMILFYCLPPFDVAPPRRLLLRAEFFTRYVFPRDMPCRAALFRRRYFAIERHAASVASC